MMKFENKKIIPLLILTAIPLVITIILFDRLPEQIPTHWNFAGEIDKISPKFPYAFLLPGLTFVMPLLMTIMPKFDPKRENYSIFKGAYYWIQLCMVLVFGGLSIIVILYSLGYNFVKVDIFVKLIIGALFAVFGNLMPKLKHNYFIGVRTPWTLANEDVWFATHRIAGYIWFIAGILAMVLAFIPGKISAYVYFADLMLAALIPTVYSFVKFRNLSGVNH